MENALVSTRKELFVEYVVNGEGLAKAAEKAGYNPDSAPAIIRGALVSRKLRGHARELMRGKIDLEGAPEGFRVLIMLLRDEQSPKALRADIAKFLVNHSIPAPKAMSEEGLEDKAPHEMTSEELRGHIRKIDDELSKRGQMIDATPIEDIDSII